MMKYSWLILMLFLCSCAASRKGFDQKTDDLFAVDQVLQSQAEAWNRGDDELAGDLYEATQALLETAGLPAYEISNHARPGEESRHNLTYWRYGDYVGIGPGAHGRLTLDRVKSATRAHRAPEVCTGQPQLELEATEDAFEHILPLAREGRA